MLLGILCIDILCIDKCISKIMKKLKISTNKSINIKAILSLRRKCFIAKCVFQNYFLNNNFRNYKKFIILGSSRTGSNFLQSLLNSHNNVVCHGELLHFRPEKAIYTKDNHFPFSKFETKKNKEIVKFLNSIYSYGYTPDTKAVGFRVHYPQFGDYGAELKYYFNYMPGLKIIHLYRKNLLNSYLSLQLALKTNKWSLNKNDKNIIYDPITLDYKSLVKYFKNIENRFQSMNTFFKNKELVKVSYEELLDSRDRKLVEILQFLNLPKKKLSSHFKKQLIQKPSDVILNYHTLKRKFRESNWEQFFNC